MKTIHLVFAMLLTLLAASATISFEANAQVQARHDARVALHVDGMHCASCGPAVSVVLRRLAGVREVAINLAEKRARVAYDPARVSPERMVQAIRDLGYEARVER